MHNIPIPAWGLIGVVVGFCLSEGTRLLREKCRIHKLKRVLKAELQAVKGQIRDKKDILLQAIQACENNRVLPMVSVRMVRTGYDVHINDLYETYSTLERNCLHVIYERLRISDEKMDSFHKDMEESFRAGVVEQPWDVAISQLSELSESYTVIDYLIQSFLDGDPENVFAESDSANANE